PCHSYVRSLHDALPISLIRSSLPSIQIFTIEQIDRLPPFHLCRPYHQRRFHSRIFIHLPFIRCYFSFQTIAGQLSFHFKIPFSSDRKSTRLNSSHVSIS